MNQGHEIRTVLDRAAKWTIFVVKKVRVWEAPRHPSTEPSPDSPPAGIQTRFFLIGEIMTFISIFIYELFAISLLAVATLWRTLQPSPLSQYICISSCAEISFTGVALKVFNFSAVLPEFAVTSVLKNEIFVCVSVGICLLYLRRYELSVILSCV